MNHRLTASVLKLKVEREERVNSTDATSKRSIYLEFRWKESRCLHASVYSWDIGYQVHSGSDVLKRGRRRGCNMSRLRASFDFTVRRSVLSPSKVSCSREKTSIEWNKRKYHCNHIAFPSNEKRFFYDRYTNIFAGVALRLDLPF